MCVCVCVFVLQSATKVKFEKRGTFVYESLVCTIEK